MAAWTLRIVGRREFEAEALDRAFGATSEATTGGRGETSGVLPTERGDGQETELLFNVLYLRVRYGRVSIIIAGCTFVMAVFSSSAWSGRSRVTHARETTVVAPRRPKTHR